MLNRRHFLEKRFYLTVVFLYCVDVRGLFNLFGATQGARNRYCYSNTEKVFGQEEEMKPILNEFCCLAPLRSGCVIIALFYIITATMSLVGYFSSYGCNDCGQVETDGEIFLPENVRTISLIGCAFNYVTAAVLIVGIFVEYLFLVVSAVAMLLYTIFLLCSAAYLAHEGNLPNSFAILIYSALQLYFILIVYSYYLEIKEQTKFWASIDEVTRFQLEQSRVEAKIQKQPDPMRAAIQKYRAPLDDDESPAPKKPVKAVTKPAASPAPGSAPSPSAKPAAKPATATASRQPPTKQN